MQSDCGSRLGQLQRDAATEIEAPEIEATRTEAPEADAPPQLAERPKDPADQRTEERYPVSGNAEVILNRGASMYRGRIVNLSLNGCYVQYAAPMSLRPGTPVEVVASVRGTSIRVVAESRYSTPRVGMGFRFLAMTDETRRKLAKLVAQLHAESRTGPDPRT